MDEIDIEYQEMVSEEILDAAHDAIPEGHETVYDSVESEDSQECAWCQRAREIFFGAAAVGIALVFLGIGIDLATNGALSARWARTEERNDDGSTTE